jgi:glycosyltransferase involved in cell wall biosynthesis
MNILWISGSRIIGGAERVTFQVLGELRHRGHFISALYRDTPKFEQELREAGIRGYPANLGGSLNFVASIAIKRAFSELRPDIALVTTSDEWVWASVIPRGPTRLVLVRHMALPLPARVRRLANLRADAIVAVSEAVRTSLLRNASINPERLHVIPNPVRFEIRDSVPSSTLRMECRKSLGIPTDGRWSGFFGGTDPQKGIRDVLQAVGRIVDTIGPCNVLVCGRKSDDSHHPTVDELAVEYRVGDGQILYLGAIDAVEHAMMACDAIAIATHQSLSEGSPLTALEAMACGVPVAAYNVGGMAEVLGAGAEGGLLANPDDPNDLARQLGRLLGDHDFAINLAMRGLERMRARFNPKLAADRYESLFRQLVDRLR